MINGLSLFSGIGGLDLALSEWVRPVAYCEIERYAAAVLFSRMLDGSIPTAPIFPDVTKLTGKILPSIDIIYGGFPCQDISVAGRGKGLEGKRSGLFFEAVRLVRECKPEFIFLENVGGIRKYVPTVRRELEEIGYDCRDGFLSAAEVGANHHRNRWWLLAHTKGERRGAWNRDCRDEKREPKINDLPTFKIWDRKSIGEDTTIICRRNNGIPNQLDRIKGLGNAVVPLQAKEAFKRLMGIK